MSTLEPIILPIATVQPTFHEVIHEVDQGIVPEESFWVSCYKEGEPSIHTKVLAELDPHDRDQVNLTSQDKNVTINAGAVGSQVREQCFTHYGFGTNLGF